MQERHLDGQRYFKELAYTSEKYLIPFIESELPVTPGMRVLVPLLAEERGDDGAERFDALQLTDGRLFPDAAEAFLEPPQEAGKFAGAGGWH